MFSSLLSIAAVLCFAGGLVSGQRVGPMPIDGSGHTPLNTAYSSAPVDNRAGGQFRGAFYYPLDPSGNTISVEPNPRLISNMVMGASSLSPINEHAVSALTVAFGQFIAHDLVKTQATGINSLSSGEVLNITGPPGDPVVNSHFVSEGKMRFPRGLYDQTTGTAANNPRVHLNFQTAWLDGSVIYGPSSQRLSGLRTFFRGLVIEDPVNGLPVNSACLPMAGGNPCRLRLAGDVRANVAPGILALHGLFVLEHNRVARRLYQSNPSWSDERLFQEARKRVVATLQAVHYNEYMPLLVGGDLPPYRGYNSSVDPRISVQFAVAAYRYGHSGIGTIYYCILANGEACPQGHLILRDNYFNPSYLDNGITIADLLRGMTVSMENKIDTLMSWDARNKVEGTMGNDLAVLDIMRGRDFGLPTLNQARLELGLPPYASFAELTSDVRVQTALATVYNNDINAVELWPGGLAESGASTDFIGRTFRAIIADQFRRLRDGDVYHYENTALLNQDGSRYLTDAEIAEIKATKLADVIARNTDWEAPPRSVMAAQSQLMLIEANVAVPSANPVQPAQGTASPSPASGNGVVGGATPTPSAASGKRTFDINGVITMDWTTPAASETSITITFTFKGVGWFGIGLQSASMVGADTIMMRFTGGRAEVVDSKANSYAMPATDSQQDVSIVSASQSAGRTVITIRRALNTGDSNDAVIGKGAMPCVFAWDYSSTAYGYHSSNRATKSVDFLAADDASASTAGLDDAQQAALLASFGVHGLTMWLVWGLLVPASVFAIRFFKHISSSVIFHKFASITAATVTLPAAAAALVSTKQGVSLAHMWVGMCLSATVAVQVVVGVALRSWLRNDKPPPSYWRNFRTFHRWCGWIQVLAGLVQMYLGARILFRGYGVYIVLGWNVLLILAFIAMTGYYEFTRDATRTTSTVVFDKDNARRLAMSQSSTSMTMAEVKELVKGGAKFVIMSGYVYDVGSFVKMHPGGAFLLERAIGSDVSQFFLGRESFDNGIAPHMHSDRAYALLRTMCVAALKAELNIKSWAEAPTLDDNSSTDAWKLVKKTKLSMDPNEKRPIFKLEFSHPSALASAAITWKPSSFGRYMVVKIPSFAIESQRQRLGIRGGPRAVQNFTTSSTALGRLVTGLFKSNNSNNNNNASNRNMLMNAPSTPYDYYRQQQMMSGPPGLRSPSSRSASMPPAFVPGARAESNGSQSVGGSAEYSQPGSVTGRVPKHIERAATQWFARSQRRLSLEHGLQLPPTPATARGENTALLPAMSPYGGFAGATGGGRSAMGGGARIAPEPRTPATSLAGGPITAATNLRHASINGPPPISFVPGEGSDSDRASRRSGRRDDDRGRPSAQRRSRSEEPRSPANTDRLPPIRAPRNTNYNDTGSYANASNDAIGLMQSGSAINNSGGDTPLGGADAMMRANRLKGQAASAASSFYGGYAYNGGNNYAAIGAKPPSLSSPPPSQLALTYGGGYSGGYGGSATYRPPFGPPGGSSFPPAPTQPMFGGAPEQSQRLSTLDLTAPGATIERPYTIVRADNKEGLILYVRKYPKGLVSSYLSNLEVGEEVLMSGPKGLGLHLDDEQGGIVVAIMQGTCSAAVLDLLQHIWAASEERKARKGNKATKKNAWSREQFEEAERKRKAEEKAKEQERRDRKERSRERHRYEDDRRRPYDHDSRDGRDDRRRNDYHDDGDQYYRKDDRDLRDRRDRDKNGDRDRDRDRRRRDRSDESDRDRRDRGRGESTSRTPAPKRDATSPEVPLPGSATSNGAAADTTVVIPGSRASRTIAPLVSPAFSVGKQTSSGKTDPLAELLVPSDADGEKRPADSSESKKDAETKTTLSGSAGASNVLASRTSTSSNTGGGSTTTMIASRVLRERVIDGTATEADFEAARLEAQRAGLSTDVVPNRMKVGGVTITLAKEESRYRDLLRSARSRQRLNASDDDDNDSSSNNRRRGRSERAPNTRSSNPRDGEDSDSGYYNKSRNAKSEGARGGMRDSRRRDDRERDRDGRRYRDDSRDDDRRRRTRDQSYSSADSRGDDRRRGRDRRENRSSNSDSEGDYYRRRGDEVIKVKRYRDEDADRDFRSRPRSPSPSYRSDDDEGRKLLSPRSSKKDSSYGRRGRYDDRDDRRGGGRRDYSSDRDRSRSRERDRVAVDVLDERNKEADEDASSTDDEEAGLMSRPSARPLSGRRRRKGARPGGAAGFSEAEEPEDNDVDAHASSASSKAAPAAGSASSAASGAGAPAAADFPQKRPRFKLVLMLVMENVDCVPEADYLRFMDASLDDFELHINVSRQADQETALRSFPRVTFGRLNARRLERLLPPANLLTVSLCGTPSFVSEVRKIFLEMGLPRTLISVTG